MPELPEVETIVRGLNKKVRNRTFVAVWTDFKKLVKRPNFDLFKKELKGKKIKKIWRRGKNIIFELSGDKTLLIHQKMTGHLLFGKWGKKKGKWISLIKGPIKEDPMNRFLHLIFWLNNGFQLALCDLRKFAKVELWDSNDFKKSESIINLGPEPLEKSFTFNKFKECFKNKKAVNGEPRIRRGKIKKVLMDQNVISGIGNIYADEILWETKIHPLFEVSKLDNKKLRKIYIATRKILKEAIKLGGTSISDFRKLSGEKGLFGEKRMAYKREKKECYRCKTIIKRIKVGGRSSCFCPRCQKL